MVKYFPKHHSLTLLSHLASLFIKVEVLLTIEALCLQIFLLMISLNTRMTLNSIPSVGMSVFWGWFKRKQVGPLFRITKRNASLATIFQG